MNECEIKELTRRRLQSWIDDKVKEKMKMNKPVQATHIDEFLAAVRAEIYADWEDLLNRLHIRSIEHLEARPLKEGCFRIKDCFPSPCPLWENRYIEISLDVANKIIILGIP